MIKDISLITSDEINEKGVCAEPDLLSGTPEQNKKVFDRLCREVIVPKLNLLIEEAESLEEITKEEQRIVDEIKNLLDKVNSTMGDISSVEIDGDTLCEKITNFEKSFIEIIKNLLSDIGSLESLPFNATSVVNALKYLYSIISPGVINFAPLLHTPTVEDLMKIYRIFDIENNSHSFFVCKARLPKESGFAKGDICERIYIDPYVVKERFSAFCHKHKDEMSGSNALKQMNIMVFENEENGDSGYIKIRYYAYKDQYVLSIYKNGECIPFWASDNFLIDGVSHVAGINGDAFTDVFSGCTITEIIGDLSWLLNTEYFESEFYWEELGKGSTVNANVSKNGKYTTLSIETSDGIKTAVIEDGMDGYMPVKGKDYFTDDEIEQFSESIENRLKGDIQAALSVGPEFANDIGECVDQSKLYVLPDGYIYAYMTKMEVVDPPELIVHGDDKNYQLNKRLNSSSAEAERNGVLLTDNIDVSLKSPFLVKFQGVQVNVNYDVYIRVYYYNGNTCLGNFNPTPAQFKTFSNPTKTYELDIFKDEYANATSVRFWTSISSDTATPLTDSDVASLSITIPAQGGIKTTTDWHNTGHAFVPADYEDRIINLEDDVLKLKGGENNEITVPSFWEEALDEAVNKIKEKKRAFGRDCVSFAFFSDNHQRLGYSGALISSVMKKCNIPFAFFGGDSISSDYISDSNRMENQEVSFAKMMECLEKGRFFRALGNHDGYYKVPTGEKYDYSWEEKHDLFLAPMGVYQNMHFGGDGTYYYVDDIVSETRFIVLNSVWFNYKTNEDGTTNNTDGAGFGNDQINWLKDVLLNTDEKFGVVFVSHSPITNAAHSNIRDYNIVLGLVNAFVKGESFAGQYQNADDEGNNCSVSVNFSRKGKVIGWFSGHVHKDTIETVDASGANALEFKCVTVTSDANSSYDSQEGERNLLGDTGHAIDFVTANVKTGQVYITRLGIGNDRTYSFI